MLLEPCDISSSINRLLAGQLCTRLNLLCTLPLLLLLQLLLQRQHALLLDFCRRRRSSSSCGSCLLCSLFSFHSSRSLLCSLQVVLHSLRVNQSELLGLSRPCRRPPEHQPLHGVCLFNRRLS